MAIPVITSPGIELTGASPREVFQKGRLLFEYISKLPEFVPADARLNFMDLSIEAEAFGSEIIFFLL